jgi:hypothetical protein
VTLLICNRPALTARVFERIAAAQPTHLLVVADGPRTPADRERCLEVRRVATAVTWPCTVLTNFSEENLGVGRRIPTGITWALNEVGESIILEDDCLPEMDFFPYSWALLDRFRTDVRIMHIGGESYYEAAIRYPHSYYFSKYSLPWGWATWMRAWVKSDVSLAGWSELVDLPLAASLFDSREEAEYWYSLIRSVLQGAHQDTWDYQWQLACWLQGGLAVHPRVNLISNLGFGDEATHTRGPSALAQRSTGALGALVHPPWVIRDRAADRATFDTRYPGAYLRRRRTLGYRLTLPVRRIKRWLMD